MFKLQNRPRQNFWNSGGVRPSRSLCTLKRHWVTMGEDLLGNKCCLIIHCKAASILKCYQRTQNYCQWSFWNGILFGLTQHLCTSRKRSVSSTWLLPWVVAPLAPQLKGKTLHIDGEHISSKFYRVRLPSFKTTLLSTGDITYLFIKLEIKLDKLTKKCWCSLFGKLFIFSNFSCSPIL